MGVHFFPNPVGLFNMMYNTMISQYQYENVHYECFPCHISCTKYFLRQVQIAYCFHSSQKENETSHLLQATTAYTHSMMNTRQVPVLSACETRTIVKRRTWEGKYLNCPKHFLSRYIQSSIAPVVLQPICSESTESLFWLHLDAPARFGHRWTSSVTVFWHCLERWRSLYLRPI